MNEIDEDQWWDEAGRPPTEEEMEWYRLWFEFLKLSDRQKWSDSVKEDFGDVSCRFEDWWPDHSHLFRQLKHFTINEVITDDDFQIYKDDGSDPDDLPVVILAVHLYESKAALRAAFEEILSKYHKGKAGRPDFDHWGDVYDLKSRPDTDMLKKILAVYQVYTADQEKPENKRMKLWEIEEEVSKTIVLIDKTGKTASFIWKTKDVHADTIESRRRSQLTTVRKYLNYTEEILENIVVGDFPVYTVSKQKAKNSGDMADD